MFLTHGEIAFRRKIRSDFEKGRSINDERQYAERTKLAMEVANVLKSNIVQAHYRAESDAWGEMPSLSSSLKLKFGSALRMTKDTELGVNTSLKNPPPADSKPVECEGSKSRRKAKEASGSELGYVHDTFANSEG